MFRKGVLTVRIKAKETRLQFDGEWKDSRYYTRVTLCSYAEDWCLYVTETNMNRKINERMSGGPAVRDSFMTRKGWRVADVVIIGASSTPLDLRPATSKLREQCLLSV